MACDPRPAMGKSLAGVSFCLERMKQGKNRRKPEVVAPTVWFKEPRNVLQRLAKLFRSSNFGAAFLILLIVGVYFTARFLAQTNQHAQVKFVEQNDATQSTEPADPNAISKEIFSGTKYETALRLRECGALGIAVSLSVFARSTATGKAPQTAQEVISELVDRKLLPPGLISEGNSLRSASSRFRLNYKASPLSFEIVSLPIDPRSGPAVLFQFPLPPSGGNSAMYYQNLEQRTFPAPFSNTEQLVGGGWKISHWRTDDLALDGSSIAEIRKQNEWIKSLVPAN